MNGKEESSALEFLDSLLEGSQEATRAGRRERLRLELARFMKKARDEAGMTQHDVAKALGVSQGWVSKLESPNYDHKLESVLTYFDALGAEMNLSVDVGPTTFQVWGTSPTLSWDAVIPDLPFELSIYETVGWDQLGGCWSYKIETGQEHTHSASVVDIHEYQHGRGQEHEVADEPREANAT